VPYFGAGLAQPLGVGIVIGAALAYFIVAGIPIFLKTAEYYRKARMGRWGGAAILLLCLILIYTFNLSLPPQAPREGRQPQEGQVEIIRFCHTNCKRTIFS